MNRTRTILLACLLFSGLEIPLLGSIVPVRAAGTQTLYPIADAYVDSDHPSSNYGGSSYLYAQFWDFTSITDVRDNSFLMFNLTAFATRHDLTSAHLRLYAWSAWSPTAHVSVHNCPDTAWSEIEINWLNAPPFSPVASDTVAVPFEDTWYSWDITNLVNNTLGSRMTIALTVEDIGDTYLTSFYSKDGYSNHPELVLEFKDGQPPTYTNFHVSKNYVKTEEYFDVSVNLYDPSGISQAQASFLDQTLRQVMLFTLDGSGGNGTYAKSGFFTSAMSDGTYNIKIRATDGVGNAGESSVLGSITLDNTPPTTPVPDDGVSGRSRINTPAFNWPAVFDSMSGVAGYYWKVDDGSDAWTTGTSVTLTAQSDGSHTFYVKAKDTAGNTGNYGQHGFQIDTVQPNVAINSPENRTYSTSSVYLGFTVTEATSWIGYSLDGYSNVTIAGNTTLPSLVDGSHNIIIYARDSAGNTGVSSRVTFAIDTNPPNIANVFQIPLKENVQPNQSARISANVTDFGSGLKSVELTYLTNGSAVGLEFPMTLNQTSGLYEYAILGQEARTLVKFRITAIDNAGNSRTEDNAGEYYRYKVNPLCDLDGDGIVTLEDVDIAVQAFGSRPGSQNWNLIADTNGDGKIDMRDIAFVAKNFGKTYS